MSRAGRGRDRFGPSLLKSAWEASRCFGAKKTRRDRPDAWSEALPCLTAIAVLRRESGRDGSWIQVCEKWFPAQSEGSSFAADHGWFGFSATIPPTAHFARTARTNWPTGWLHGCGKKHASLSQWCGKCCTLVFLHFPFSMTQRAVVQNTSICPL